MTDPIGTAQEIACPRCHQTCGWVGEVIMTGRWADQVKEHADRFALGGKLGCDVRLNPDAAAAVGEVIANLARVLDATEDRCAAAHRLIAAQRAERESFGRMVRDLALIAAWVTAVLIGAWLLG